MNRLFSRLGGGRNSNIELLRLLSMLMVLNLHSFKGYANGEGILQALDFFRESTSICAVNVFLLISGYFGIKWKLKSISNLIFQLFFYAFIVYLVAVMIGVVDFSVSGLLKNITFLYTHWGFITKYLLLYLCAPMLNVFTEQSTKKEMLGFIFILVISENLFTRSYHFLNFCTMYLIGRYISINDLVNNIRIKAGYWYWITTILIFILVYVTFKILHVNSPVIMQSLPWGYDYAAPLVIMQAIFLFIWFARLKIQSNLINWCATSCLAIFLIHMHPSIKYIGYYGYTNYLYSLPILEHVCKLLVLISVVFVGSIVIDKIRIFIYFLFLRCFSLFLKNSKSKIDRFMPYIPNNIK